MPAKHEIRMKHPITAKQNRRSKIRKWFETGGELFCSLLFPPRCPVCDEILTPEEAEKGIHLACESKLYPVEGAVCMHCGRPLGQINSRDVKLHREKEGEESYAEKEGLIPAYLRIESTYEYCLECRRKGYAPELPPYRKSNSRGMNPTASNITQAKSLYLYKGAIKKSMYRFKYANKREYASFFARQAVEKHGAWLGIASYAPHIASITSRNSVSVRTSADTDRFDVIIPVPMYRPKQKQRGYNQAEVFATELSKMTGIPVDRDYIRRIKDTTPQKKLNDAERKNNLENAFQKMESIVQYNKILVIDDIYTTGYTAEAVAGVLKKGQDCQVYLLSICIGGNN